MARHCECRALLEALETDPRLRLVPLAARMVWLLLARALARMPEPGVFRMGLRVGSVKEIAVLVSCAETEAETHLETLVGIGLLERHDGVIVVPGMPEVGRKAAAARGNGGLGGRPRRGETAEEARLRRAQQHMALPIQGGRAETHETHGETLSRADADARQDDKKEQSGEVSDVVAFGAECAEAARMDPARGRYDFRPVMNWRGMGLPDQVILDVIRSWAARPGYRVPQSLGYFARGMQEAKEALPAGAVAGPVDQGRAVKIRDFISAVEEWERRGKPGPMPVHPDRVAA